MNSKYKALDIANYFVEKYGEAKDNYGIKLSPMKLQKLLYYAFGAIYAITDIAPFDEDIIAWEHGPVVKEVYLIFKNTGYIIEDINGKDTKQYNLKVIGNYNKIDAETAEILDDTYEMFGKRYDYWQLRNLTHKETPWLTATKGGEIVNGRIINKDEIKQYFEGNYIIND